MKGQDFSEGQPTYSSYTYNSPGFLKRALHRNRYRNILKDLHINGETSVLDFGAGDGRLFRVMIDEFGANAEKLIAFDPVPAMQREFSVLVPEVQISGNCDEIMTPKPGEEFDYIFCCEVFEHLTEAQVDFSLKQFVRLAGPKTLFVIEVPIEIGPFGFMKNLYRRFKSGVDVPFLLMIRALLGIEQKRKPRVLATGEETFEHPGYSFSTTKNMLARVMTIHKTFNDPFRHAPFIVNNSRIFIGKIK